MSSYSLTRQAAFRAARAAGEIKVWQPILKGAAARRILALDEDLYARLANPWGDPDSDLEALRQEIMAACDAFVNDTIALRALFDEIGGRLGVAEMKILAPDPGARIIGGFLHETVFVGCSLLRRDELPYKRNGDQTTHALIDWETLNRTTAKRLSELFGEEPLYRPLSLR